MAYDEAAIKRAMVSEWDKQFQVGQEVVHDDTKTELLQFTSRNDWNGSLDIYILNHFAPGKAVIPRERKGYRKWK